MSKKTYVSVLQELLKVHDSEKDKSLILSEIAKSLPELTESKIKSRYGSTVKYINDKK